MREKHSILPVYDSNSEILILGSFPSVKSREEGFFYAHAQNRFWKVLAKILSCRLPISIDEKKKMLFESKIALWDVVGSCDITGSSDSSIKNVVPNDLTQILKNSNIKRIYLNGRTAEKLYNKYMKKDIFLKSECLPSTSPANAAWSLERLEEEWKKILY